MVQAGRAVVPPAGLEPARPRAPNFKFGAATDFAKGARRQALAARRRIWQPERERDQRRTGSAVRMDAGEAGMASTPISLSPPFSKAKTWMSSPTMF